MNSSDRRGMRAGGALLAAACAALMCGHVYAVTEGSPASTLSRSDLQGNIAFSGGSAGSITVTFGMQSEPIQPCSGRIVADTSVPGSVFSGDYSAVSEMSFTIAGDGHQPGGMIVFLTSGSRTWYRRLDVTLVSAVAGQVTTVAVPLKLAAGWKTSCPGDKAAMWATDVKQVDVTAISLSQGGLDAQSYTVANIMLDGKLGGLRLVPQRVLDYFGVTSLDGIDLTLDTDGDGMADYLEVWAGTDPNSPNSVFAAKIVEVVGDTAKVQWPCVSDATYTVLRADKVGGAFSILDAKVGADNPFVAVVDGKMTYQDETAKEGVANFYKVVLE